jgi:hypothetical protein
MKTPFLASSFAALCLAACSSPDAGTAKAPPAAPAAAAAAPSAPTPAAPSAPQPAPARTAAFDQTLELQGVTFKVTCPNASSINKLTITPSGLTGDNAPITQEIDGIVTGAEVADVNSDGSPEIYVYVQSAGSGSYGSVVAYSVNKKKSLSMIYLPPVSESPKLSRGYMGHDAFAVVETRFVQRFPVYKPGDTNASPTGGMRQLHYKLAPGEAGWVLKLDKVEEF